MKLSHIAVCLSVALLGVSGASRAEDEGDEHSIDRSALPAGVSATVDRVSAGAKVRGLSEEMEDGRTYYEAELKVDGHSKDVLIDENGTVVEIEEEVEIDSLPKVVRETLSRRAEGGRIVSIESITRQGALVGYEAHIRAGGRTAEVTVSPQGQVRN